jgi:hypothetical protein
MTLTKEQRDIVAQGGNVRVNVEGLDCVLVRTDVFERVRQVMGDEWTHDELRAALARAYESSDWSAPEMDLYDEYDQRA